MHIQVKIYLSYLSCTSSTIQYTSFYLFPFHYIHCSKPAILKKEHTSELPDQLIKTQPAGPHASLWFSKWGLKTYISNKFPGDTDAAGAGTTL